MELIHSWTNDNQPYKASAAYRWRRVVLLARSLTGRRWLHAAGNRPHTALAGCAFLWRRASAAGWILMSRMHDAGASAPLVSRARRAATMLLRCLPPVRRWWWCFCCWWFSRCNCCVCINRLPTGDWNKSSASLVAFISAFAVAEVGQKTTHNAAPLNAGKQEHIELLRL